MDDLVNLGTQHYGIYWGLLVLARSMDFLSTWIATPNLALEANPIARRLGWKWGALVNILMCTALAAWPLPAIVISTTSLLVAARNLHYAWLMRTMGEDDYRDWMITQLGQTPLPLYLFCLFTQNALTAGIGVALMLFSNEQLVPFGIGMGLVTYALAVTFYSLLSIWRLRRPASPPAKFPVEPQTDFD